MHDMYTLVHFADKNDMGGKPSQIQCFSESQDQINRYMYRLATLIHVINAIPLTKGCVGETDFFRHCTLCFGLFSIGSIDSTLTRLY